MNGILKIFNRFLPKYKKYVILAFVFNILTAILNVFSFVTIQPILEILFKIEKKVYTFISWDDDKI